MFIKNGAKVNIENKDGATALHVAAKNGNYHDFTQLNSIEILIIDHVDSDFDLEIKYIVRNSANACLLCF